MSEQTLELSARISVPGGWLMLTQDGYSLASDTLAQIDRQVRENKVAGDFTKGEWTVSAVPGNDVWPLAVRVRSSTVGGAMPMAYAVRDALQQHRFTVQTAIDDWEATWYCFATGVTIEAPQSLLFARQALVRAQMTSLPIT